MKRPALFFFTAGKRIFPARNSAEKSGLSVDGRTPDPVLFAADEPDNIVLDSDTVQEIVLRLQGMNIGETTPATLVMAFHFFRDAIL